MRICAESVIVPASFEKVFEYIAEPSNLPSWSVNFILGLEKGADGKHRVKTPMGEQELEIKPDKKIGTVDMIFYKDGQRTMFVPTRAVPLGEETLYLFTLILPDLPDKAVEGARADLQEELFLLRDQVAHIA